MPQALNKEYTNIDLLWGQYGVLWIWAKVKPRSILLPKIHKTYIAWHQRAFNITHSDTLGIKQSVYYCPW